MVTKAEIAEIEQFFKDKSLPASIKTREGVIYNVKQYVESHLRVLHSHNPLKAYKGYYFNLIALREQLKSPG